jgi:hypothetical protein
VADLVAKIDRLHAATRSLDYSQNTAVRGRLLVMLADRTTDDEWDALVADSVEQATS